LAVPRMCCKDSKAGEHKVRPYGLGDAFDPCVYYPRSIHLRVVVIGAGEIQIRARQERHYMKTGRTQGSPLHNAQNQGGHNINPKGGRSKQRPYEGYRHEKQKNAVIPESGEFILYQAEDGRTRIHCRFAEETIWLTQAQIAELFQTTPQNVTLHLKTINADGELNEGATCKEYFQVRQEGSRCVSCSLRHYRLEAIVAVEHLWGHGQRELIPENDLCDCERTFFRHAKPLFDFDKKYVQNVP